MQCGEEGLVGTRWQREIPQMRHGREQRGAMSRERQLQSGPVASLRLLADLPERSAAQAVAASLSLTAGNK